MGRNGNGLLETDGKRELKHQHRDNRNLKFFRTTPVIHRTEYDVGTDFLVSPSANENIYLPSLDDASTNISEKRN